MRMRSLCSGLLIGLTLSAAPVRAHHSFAATFTNEIIVVEGVVEQLKFSNPHVIVYFKDELVERIEADQMPSREDPNDPALPGFRPK